MRTMTDSEKSDTDIRQSMFQALANGYLGSLKEDLAKTDEASFRRRMMFLELLTVNFQEVLQHEASVRRRLPRPAAERAGVER